MPKLTRVDDELHLALSGAADFQGALSAVKSISGRRYDPDTKLWKFSASPATAERILLTVKPSADATILQWVRNSRAEREQELTTAIPDDCREPLWIPWSDTLYDFQRALVEFLQGHLKAIVADDMGLGKTVQALSTTAEYIIRNPDVDPNRPRLIICPASALGVWEREIKKWLGKDEPYSIISGATAPKRNTQLKAAIAEDGCWIIVNWEQLRVQKHVEEKVVHHRDGSVSNEEVTTWLMKQPLFEDTNWLSVFADEAHRAKNRKAAQSKGLWRISADIQLALTGTPLMNSPDELWSLLRWLYPEQYGNSTPGHPRTAYWPFHDEYTETYEGYKNSKVVIGVKNPDSLRFELKDRLVRRTKAQKLSLPDKTREHIPLPMNKEQAKIYAEAETQFWLTIMEQIEQGDEKTKRFAEEVLEDKKRIYEIPNGAARLVRMRQVLCSPALLGGVDDSAKMDAIVENILDNSHQQHGVFTEFVMGANILVERLTKKGVVAEAFTGEVSDTAIRSYYEDQFQEGKIDVLVGTLGAMSESITLTAANIAHFCERFWVPGKNEQAEDRFHRVGQINPVTILIYENTDTVDTEKVRVTNELKEMIVSDVIVKDAVKEVG